MTWPTVALGDLCEINIGRTPSRSRSDYWGPGLPWLSIADMNQGRDLTRTKETVTEAAAREAVAKQAAVGTVLLSFKLSVGKVGIVRRPMYTNEAIAALPIRDNSPLFSEYLYWALKSLDLTHGTDRAAMGQTLNKAKLLAIQVPLPPLDAQRRIAEVLDRADALRAKRRQVLSGLDDLVGAIFLDMFGDPAGNPRAWPLTPMSDLFLTNPLYGTMTPAMQEPRGWLCLRVANIQDWTLDLSDRKYVDLASEAVEKHSVASGDLLLARAIATEAHLGKAIVARPGNESWAFDSHLMRLRLDHRLALSDFVCHLLRSPGGRSRFLRITRRSSVQFNVNTKEIARLEIPLPPITLQEDFVERVSEVDRIRRIYSTHMTELDTLFNCLQHRAFRGEL